MTDVIISDHALIRYIERVHGLNLDPLRREIENIVLSGSKTGARNIISNGFIFSIKRRENGDIAVATILTPGMREKSRNWKPHKKHRQEVTA